jgi:hypothetical protein
MIWFSRIRQQIANFMEELKMSTSVKVIILAVITSCIVKNNNKLNAKENSSGQKNDFCFNLC